MGSGVRAGGLEERGGVGEGALREEVVLGGEGGGVGGGVIKVAVAGRVAGADGGGRVGGGGGGGGGRGRVRNVGLGLRRGGGRHEEFGHVEGGRRRGRLVRVSRGSHGERPRPRRGSDRARIATGGIGPRRPISAVDGGGSRGAESRERERE